MKIEFNDWNKYEPNSRVCLYITFTAEEIGQFMLEQGMEKENFEKVIRAMIEGGLAVGLGY